ncbi:MAG TPA: helix-turn-helix transcriptional regulator [Polyangia bacterium]|nr:helix-turn-helix transcriptional regulator [Polyangia bacterium]
MAPFGETVLAWRLARGMSQAEVARAARLPRPNLSAIERGDRDVTLRTLRALAAALDVRPGALVDGELPGQDGPPLSRGALERVASAAATGGPKLNTLSRRLRLVIGGESGADDRGRRLGPRAGDAAYFGLRVSQPPQTIASLVDRARAKIPRKTRP